MSIDSWSHSRVVDFERCKLAAWLKYDRKIPEPQRPLLSGQKEHANDRGTRLHEAAELFVKDQGPFLPELKAFEPEFIALQGLHKAGKVSLEGEWGMDRNWDPCPWEWAWHRCKLDACVHMNETEAIVIDYKSGKRFGNELKHGEQCQLYAINAFMRFPLLEEVHTELWYLDINELAYMRYTRAQALRLRANWDRRGNAVTGCTEFPPNPNIHSCRWCEYGPWNGGQCQDGVRDGFNAHRPRKKFK